VIRARHNLTRGQARQLIDAMTAEHMLAPSTYRVNRSPLAPDPGPAPTMDGVLDAMPEPLHQALRARGADPAPAARIWAQIARAGIAGAGGR
jgi:hypothetical protein